mmetsp:Transcript_114556/g.370316  ORF Transcript_114556/g.370316 Transcript_114556/m.370316 type:complete len:262 (-) Transcript_114556:1447-2232(-)
MVPLNHAFSSISAKGFRFEVRSSLREISANGVRLKVRSSLSCFLLMQTKPTFTAFPIVSSVPDSWRSARGTKPSAAGPPLGAGTESTAPSGPKSTTIPASSADTGRSAKPDKSATGLIDRTSWSSLMDMTLTFTSWSRLNSSGKFFSRTRPRRIKGLATTLLAVAPPPGGCRDTARADGLKPTTFALIHSVAETISHAGSNSSLIEHVIWFLRKFLVSTRTLTFCPTLKAVVISSAVPAGRWLMRTRECIEVPGSAPGGLT